MFELEKKKILKPDFQKLKGPVLTIYKHRN